MTIWKITEKGPVQVPQSKLHKESLLEEQLEDWIVAQPGILGEDLLVIGRQVTVPQVNDRIDILALDAEGNTVLVELKRGKLKDPVDMQALRYASYVAKWSFADFEREARNFFHGNGTDFNFNRMYETFCAEAGVDEPPDINRDQRVVIVGSEVRDKLGSVALWLLQHKVNIRVIEIECYKEGSQLMLQPNVIVPPPVVRFAEVGGVQQGESYPWDEDGRAWHLEKRCSPKTAELLLKIDDIIRDTVDVEEPKWNQKFYVAYRIKNRIWLSITTQANMLRLMFRTEPGFFSQDELAADLKVEVFDKEDSLSEKFGLPSSVMVQPRSGHDRVVLRVKDDFSPDTEQFRRLLEKAYKGFSQHPEALGDTDLADG